MSESLFYALCFLMPLALTAGAIPLVCAQALKKGYVDRPGGRKRHDDEVPPVGGLVVFPVFMLAVALSGGLDYRTVWFFSGLALLLVTGALDDAHNLSARMKMAVQIIAALLIVVPGGAKVQAFGNLLGFGDFGTGFFAIPFSVIATVLLINALNLIDGLDGLAGGLGLIVLLWLALCGYKDPDPQDVASVLMLAGALGGFLLHNMRHPLRKRASVFLGDAGSLALGLSLAWFAIIFSQQPDQALRPAGVAWLLAIPIFDTCGQFARRVSQGRHPFDADHHHFHHHFLYAGFSPGKATALILALSFFLGAAGVAGLWLGVHEAVLGWLWTILLLTHIYLSLRPHRYRRIIQKISGARQSE